MFTRKPATQTNTSSAPKQQGVGGRSLPAVPAFPKTFPGAHFSGEEVLQPQFIKQSNAYLAHKNIDRPNAGEARVANDAAYMSQETEIAKENIEDLVEKYNDGVNIKDELAAIIARAGNQEYNLNKLLYNWKKSNGASKDARLLKMCLGYVVEGYIKTLVGPRIGVNMQVSLDGCRPDFQVWTGEEWQYNDDNYYANGLIDITSAQEASAGHISGKLKNAKDLHSLNHPHLYDVYYDSIELPGAVNNPTNIQMNADHVKFLEERDKKDMIARDKRVQSLRSHRKKEKEKEKERELSKDSGHRDDRRKNRDDSSDKNRRKRGGSSSVESNSPSKSRSRSPSGDKRKKEKTKIRKY